MYKNTDSILLKAVQVAEYLNISRAMAYRLMQQGDIRTVRISGSRRVRVEDLKNYIDENIHPPLTRGISN